MKKFKIIFLMAIALFSITALNAQTAKSKTTSVKTDSALYQCPMKCEGDKSYGKAGKCPKCGMNLKAISKSETASVYQCPMKCEGDKTYDKADKCPQCGMNLKELPSGKTTAVENNMQQDMVNVKTETFKVWGNCGMCKKTIEGAVKADGVANANWDKITKVISISYDPGKISVDDMQKKIAAVGYDTEKYRGDEKAYENLPGCCQYVRKN